MKVRSPALEAYSRAALGPVNGPPPSAAPAASSSDVGSSEAAHVTVSAEARALATQHQGVNQQKVQALKNQIADGEYQVNPQMLAVRLLEALG
ncbi:MAG TPA: flagellar biosynthesis anti-sigma factor FlgM [Polyangiaceae bacterium]|nr:flagellar biosynthesis anti-sigma factor FlgM [Polyangiaceae bacterium]